MLHGKYFDLNLLEVLECQNEMCRKVKKGMIKVLNTGVFFVTDYNISLIG